MLDKLEEGAFIESTCGTENVDSGRTIISGNKFESEMLEMKKEQFQLRQQINRQELTMEKMYTLLRKLGNDTF